MLAKQVWNLIQHPESLSYRILKAKYFPLCEHLQANVGFNPSYLWRSLLTAKELVEDGEAWRVVDGQGIKVIDRWIGVQEQTKPNELLNAEIKDAKVQVLIDPQSNTWRADIIYLYFQRDEAKRIMEIPLSGGRMPDRRIWRYTKHGFFTLKTAYHVALAKFSRLHEARPSSSVANPQWKQLWSINVIPRVRMFLWRASVNALPTRANLRRRGSSIDGRCPLCGEEEESIDHLFIHCPQVQKTWYGSSLRMDVRGEAEMTFRELVWSRIDNFPKKYVELFAYTAWKIWTKRNGVCFEKGTFEPMEVAGQAQVQWQEYVEGRGRMEPRDTVRKRDTRWKPPDQGTYKLNCDVAVAKDGIIGLGMVVRDAVGEVVLAGKQEKIAEGSSTLLEGYAMQYAMQMAKQYGIMVAIVESDSKNLVEMINGRQKPEGYCDILAEDIHRLNREIGCKNFDYTSRDNNQVAHQTARAMKFISIRHKPAHLIQILESDLHMKTL